MVMYDTSLANWFFGALRGEEKRGRVRERRNKLHDCTSFLSLATVIVYCSP